MHGNKGHVELENGKPLSLSQLGKTSKHHPHDEDVLYIGEDAWQRGSFGARTTHTHTHTNGKNLSACNRQEIRWSVLPNANQKRHVSPSDCGVRNTSLVATSSRFLPRICVFRFWIDLSNGHFIVE